MEVYNKYMHYFIGVLLSIGGINSEDNITNEVFIFDISSYQQNWVQTTSMKFERMDFAVCTDQKCVYVVSTAIFQFEYIYYFYFNK